MVILLLSCCYGELRRGSILRPSVVAGSVARVNSGELTTDGRGP